MADWKLATGKDGLILEPIPFPRFGRLIIVVIAIPDRFFNPGNSGFLDFKIPGSRDPGIEVIIKENAWENLYFTKLLKLEVPKMTHIQKNSKFSAGFSENKGEFLKTYSPKVKLGSKTT